jgi:DNA invertase Pin-like site-specific DNA recombinase
MNIGYARVSTKDQNLDLQLDALQKENCSKIFKEKISGTKSERPALQDMLNQVRPGDVIIIWKLDRLGRSLKNLVEIIGQLIAQGVGLKSLHDNIDTTTPQGRLTFNIFASLAEFERDLISERTMAGLASARARGRNGGKPKGLSQQAESTACAAETLYKEGKLGVNQIATQLGIAKNTLYKYLRHRGVEINAYNLKIKYP